MVWRWLEEWDEGLALETWRPRGDAQIDAVTKEWIKIEGGKEEKEVIGDSKLRVKDSCCRV